MTSASTSRAPFVGRYDELARVRATLAASHANGFELVVVTGERGIGKTRLLAKALEVAGSAIDRVVQLSCVDRLAATDTFLDDFIRQLVGRDDVAPPVTPPPAGTWEAELASSTPAEVEARQRASLARAAAGALQATETGDAVLVVEDLHWATTTTLAFLEVLVQEMTASPYRRVALFITRRPGAPGDEIDAAVRRLLASPRGQEIIVGPLAVEEEEALVRSHTTAPTRTFVDLVRRTSAGNPLDMLATIDVLRERGIGPNITHDDPRILGRLRLPLPPDADPVVAWLSSLPSDLWKVISSCAILNDEFDVVSAAAASDLPSAEVVALLDRACEIGALTSDGVTFWFAHPHYREVLSTALKPSSRAEIHLRCLHHIQSSPSGVAARDQYAIGHHLLQAGPAMDAGERWSGLSNAGAAAIARADWVDAGRFLEAAIIDRPDNLPRKELALLHLRAGQAHFFSHDADAARRHLLASVDLAKAVDDQRTWALAARTLTRQDNTVNAQSYQRLSSMEVIRDFLDVARDPVEKALALEVLAEAHSSAGLDEDANRLAGEAIQLLDGSGDDKALALCYFSQAYGALAALRLRHGRAVETKALLHAGKTGDWFVPMAIKSRLAFLHIGLGDLAGADALASEAIAVASTYHEFAALSLGHTARAAIAMLHGDLAAADRHADRAAWAARRCGHASAAYHLAPLRTALHLAQGRTDDAETEAGAWSGLPNAALAPLRAMIERRRGSMISVPSRPPTHHVTWLGAGVLAAQVTDALEAGDGSWLESAIGQLEVVQQRELVFTASFPGALPRLLADSLCAVERYDDALDRYLHIVPQLRDAGAYPDLVRALIGQCRADSRSRTGSRDRARHAATEALELARRLDLASLQSEASALLRRDIDVHSTIRRRQGVWRVILLTDIVGSTLVSQHLGDVAYHRLVMVHHGLVRECIEQRGGNEFGDTGDGLFVWFSSTEEALDAALAIQAETTLALSLASSHRLAIKVALSGGEPLFQDGRPYGVVVNRAARLIGLAKGGDIVADEAVTEDLDRSQVEIRFGSPVELRGIGEHRPAWISPREEEPLSADPV